jgi:hypothetical protein
VIRDRLIAWADLYEASEEYHSIPTRDLIEAWGADNYLELMEPLSRAGLEHTLVDMVPALRIALLRTTLLEQALRDVVGEEDSVKDPSVWCLHCENYVRRHEPHKGGCVIPTARELLGMAIPPQEREVLERWARRG